jgi:integrase
MRSLPVECWPIADREAWVRACRPHVRLQRGGAAAHLKAITQADLARRYGYFLTHVQERQSLDLSAPAGALVQPDMVDSFLIEIRTLWRSVTQANSIYKLRRIAEILAPDRDFTWLREIEKDLALVAYPKNRFDRIVTTEMLLEAGLTLMKEAELARRRRRIWRATQFRNGLMVALLALHPIRSKNFAALSLSRSFRREGESWSIVLGSRDTKAGRPDERRVNGLNREIALYLTWARPILLGHGEYTIGDQENPFLTGALWIGEKGEPLTQGAVELAIARTAETALGITLRPHDFRRSAATTAAFRAGQLPHLASALLQHRDRRVTDEHYNRASSFDAAVKFSRIVATMRS